MRSPWGTIGRVNLCCCIGANSRSPRNYDRKCAEREKDYALGFTTFSSMNACGVPFAPLTLPESSVILISVEKTMTVLFC